MPKNVQVGNDIVEFPDSMSDDQIAEVLRKQNPAQQEQKPEEYSLSGFAGNVINSGVNFASGLAKAISDPKGTAQTMGRVLNGALDRAVPMVQKKLKEYGLANPDMTPEHLQQDRAMAGQVGQYYANRVKHPIDTIYNDPVGAAADIATVASGAGALLKGGAKAAQVVNATNLAGKLSGAARIAGKVANATDPIRLPMVAAGKAARVGAEALGLPTTAEALYESTLKPPKGKAWPIEKQQRVVSTGLEKGVVLKRGGIDSLEQVRNDIDSINAEIQQKIADGAQAGQTVDPASVAQRVDELKPFFGNQVNPEADLASLDAVKGEFMANNSTTVQPPAPQWNPFTNGGKQPAPPPPVTTPTPIPLDVAQQMKQNTYAVNRKKYGELKGAEVEAQKALARGLKEEIAQQFPEISTLNKSESALIELEDAVESFLKRTGSRDPMSLKGVISLPFLLDNPMIKSKLAIALYKARNPATTMGRIKAVGTGLIPMATPTSRVGTVLDQETPQ